MADRSRIIATFLCVLLVCTTPAYPAGDHSPEAKPPQKSVKKKTPSTHPGYTVQLVPFLEKKRAEAMMTELVGDGYSPYIFTHHNKGTGKTWYAVRIGDFSDLKSATSGLRQFKQRKKLPAFITRKSNLESILAATKSTKKNDVGSKKSHTSGRLITGEIGSESVEVIQLASAQPSIPMVAAARNADENLQQQIAELQKEVQTIRNDSGIHRDANSDVRKKLEMTKEEKAEEQEQVLTAAGRDYTLLKKGTLGLEYSFRYAYRSSDVIDSLEDYFLVNPSANHKLTNSLFTQYALKDNLTLNTNIPFVYAYDEVGSDSERDATDLGDISVGMQFQPYKTGGKLPPVILSGTLNLPTGRSPYDINTSEDLSTGSGYYSLSGGLSVSESLDPVVVFGGLNATYGFEADGEDTHFSGGRVLDTVEPGMTFGGSLGFGYALSYNLSMNLTWNYALGLETKYKFENAESIESGTTTSSSLYLGMDWRLTPKYSVHTKVGIGLTNDDPDFTVSFRLPFQFDLGS